MLLHPWNLPDKSTGVGSHSLLQDLPHPGIEPGSPALQADALPWEPSGKQATLMSLKVKYKQANSADMILTCGLA